MASEPFASVGRLVRSHGLKGELSFAPSSAADCEALVGIEAWITPPPGGGGRTRIMAFRSGPKGPLVTLAGVDSIDEARAVTGSELLVRSSDIPDGWQNEDAADLLGVNVTDESRGTLGCIVDVIQTGANDVWVVRGPLGDVLLPVIDEVVLEIDLDSRVARVKLLPGLIDEDE